MKLTDEERAMLAGERGKGRQKAMEIMAALATVFNAEGFVPVTSAQISGISYTNIGEPGLQFLREWAALGDRALIPAFLNPGGVDRILWQELGIAAEYVAKQLELIGCLTAMGMAPTLTCTPYHITAAPNMGEHLAWSESSAVVYANSVLGARTNREGGPSALAAALTGRTPCYGLHLEENRCAKIRITVRCRVASPADFAALGIAVGKLAGRHVPWIEGVEPEWSDPHSASSSLKALGAAMAASGAVGLFHLAGVTPEACAAPRELQARIQEEKTIADLEPTKIALTKAETAADLIAIGCPHLSYEELAAIAPRLRGKTVRIPLWLMTSQAVRERAAQTGLLQELQASGALVVADTCVVVAPLRELKVRCVATDSGKAASYLPSHQRVAVRFDDVSACLAAALGDVWND